MNGSAAPCEISHLFSETCPNNNKNCLLAALQVRYGKLVMLNLKVAGLQARRDVQLGERYDRVTSAYGRRVTDRLHFVPPSERSARGDRPLETIPLIFGPAADNSGAHDILLQEIRDICSVGDIRRGVLAVDARIREMEAEGAEVERALAQAQASSIGHT